MTQGSSAPRNTNAMIGAWIDYHKILSNDIASYIKGWSSDVFRHVSENIKVIFYPDCFDILSKFEGIIMASTSKNNLEKKDHLEKILWTVSNAWLYTVNGWSNDIVKLSLFTRARLLNSTVTGIQFYSNRRLDLYHLELKSNILGNNVSTTWAYVIIVSLKYYTS